MAVKKRAIWLRDSEWEALTAMAARRNVTPSHLIRTTLVEPTRVADDLGDYETELERPGHVPGEYGIEERVAAGRASEAHAAGRWEDVVHSPKLQATIDTTGAITEPGPSYTQPQPPDGAVSDAIAAMERKWDAERIADLVVERMLVHIAHIAKSL